MKLKETNTNILPSVDLYSFLWPKDRHWCRGFFVRAWNFYLVVAFFVDTTDWVRVIWPHFLLPLCAATADISVISYGIKLKVAKRLGTWRMIKCLSRNSLCRGSESQFWWRRKGWLEAVAIIGFQRSARYLFWIGLKIRKSRAEKCLQESFNTEHGNDMLSRIVSHERQAPVRHRGGYSHKKAAQPRQVEKIRWQPYLNVQADPRQEL